MGLWSLYFIAKLYLFFRGYLRFDVLSNWLFALFLLLPMPGPLKASRTFSVVRSVLNAILAVLLAWHDSWLPPMSDVLSFLRQEGLPTREYLITFFSGFFNPREVAIVSLLLVVGYLIRRHIRLTVVVLILLLIAPMRGLGEHKGDVEKKVDAFYRSESKREVRFDPVSDVAVPFDIIIIHVCSLSWDDLRAVGLESDSFLKQFDVLFTNFNSVTSYSNPSALRLLRADCGQRRHDDLYGDVPRACEIFETFRREGYRTYFTLNHDGRYGRFAEQVGSLALLDAPLFPAGLPVQAIDFDGSDIFDDAAVLERWWSIREVSGSKRAAVYYNTISLHDGAHWAHEEGWWKRNRTDQYRERIKKLFEDLTRFMDRVAASGRHALVLFVPEHGMALRGSTLQAPGLRDIPLPAITLVPVGFKWIENEPAETRPSQIVIDKPTSYLALSFLLSSALRQGPSGPDRRSLARAAEEAPETPFLAENQGVRIVKDGEVYFFYGKDRKWLTLPDEALK